MRKPFFLACFLLLSSFEEPELLKMSDVESVMNEMLHKNVGQKEMTPLLLKQSFINYINQADPRHIYLLESEVTPWSEMSDSRLNKVLSDYKRQDFTVYIELNKVIQQAIKRAENDRKEIYANANELFTENSVGDLPVSYASDLDELKSRQREDLLEYIELERQKFGAKKVLDKQQAVLKSYENKMKSFEADYIFVDSDNHPLPQKYRESLLVMHILKALSSAIDTHTTFMTPREAIDMKMRLEKEYKGIGVVFKEGIDGFYIDKLIPNSPAAMSSQVEVGDKLVMIDRLPVDHLTLSDVTERMVLDPDGRITLTLLQKGQTREITLMQVPITLTENRVDVQYEPYGNGIIGVLKLDSFYDNNEGVSADKDLRQAIRDMEKKGNLKGLILDLRNNHGGFVTQGVKVAGLFISNGVVVISRYNTGEEKIYRDIDGKKTFDGPLIVLVSRQSASAAEITAQALQDYGVAVVVGDDHTYGKGSIQSQTVTDNPGTNYFKVTVGKYYTVSGKTPEGQGVQSDIVVPGKWMESGFEGDINPEEHPEEIPNAFHDSLKDIPAEAKPWFLKYYTPTVQKPTDFWKKNLPALRKNSSYRIENNKNYQFFLKHSLPDEEKDETEEEAILKKGTKNAGVDDLQLQEAKNVLKDMIQMEQSQGLKK